MEHKPLDHLPRRFRVKRAGYSATACGLAHLREPLLAQWSASVRSHMEVRDGGRVDEADPL